MKNPTRHSAMRRKDRGQGMTEYILIVVLVAISAIAVVTIFGGDIRALFGNSTQALAGQQNVQNSAKPASTTQMQYNGKNLQTFGNNSN
jgi:Flp pilus assembly pilin Flp